MRKQLHRVLTQWMSCRQLYAEPEFYCVHKDDARCLENTIERAVEHNEEQQETGNYRNVEPQAYNNDNLLCLVCVHVDGTKGAATQETAVSFLKHRNTCVGHCKADCKSFLHTGLQHESSSGSAFIHQYVYIDSIAPIDVGLFMEKGREFYVAPKYMTHTGRSYEQ